MSGRTILDKQDLRDMLRWLEVVRDPTRMEYVVMDAGVRPEFRRILRGDFIAWCADCPVEPGWGTTRAEALEQVTEYVRESAYRNCRSWLEGIERMSPEIERESNAALVPGTPAARQKARERRDAWVAERAKETS